MGQMVSEDICAEEAGGCMSATEELKCVLIKQVPTYSLSLEGDILDNEIMDVLQTLVSKIGDMDSKIDRMDDKIDRMDRELKDVKQDVREMKEKNAAFESEMTRKVDALFDWYQQNLESNAVLEQRLDRISE